MASPHITDITRENFEQEVVKSDKYVLIDFHAAWCGPCKAMAPELEKFAAAHADTVKVVKINVDDQPELSAAFGIRSMPTLVVMKDGQALVGTVGAIPQKAMGDLVDEARRLVAERANDNAAAPPSRKQAPKGPQP